MIKVGDWVKYTETWTREKHTVISEVDSVRSTHRLTLYGVTAGYILTDRMILEVRAK